LCSLEERSAVDWTGFPREHTRCILCGADSGELLSIQRSWPVVRCRKCGFVYLCERPSESALEELYSKAYYEDGDVGYKGYMETFQTQNEIFMRLFARRERDLRRRVRGRRLLEVGCAYGLLLDYLARRGWDVAGVEVSPLSSAYAREKLGLEVRTGALETAGFSEGSFDAVLLLDVLEHLHRPFETLREISRVLAPGGVLVVQCPWELFHWEEVMQAILTGHKPGTIEPDAVPAHLYFFGPETLERMLRKGGFRIAGRQSGNYGEVRRRVLPPYCSSRNPFVRSLHFAYHRMGIQRMLYVLARLAGLGNGLIRYAVSCQTPEPDEKSGS
jgi:2-polyprenyl-3-methyl-5-hydroxy-6-metoxy-1,4-benzoquinol methylase